jgi:hypothetical protein
MTSIHNPHAFSNAITAGVRGLENLGVRQTRALEKAMDVDGNGQVSYLPEYGSAHSFVSGNYVQSRTYTVTELKPGVAAKDVVAGLQRRKDLIKGIASAFVDKTFEQGRKDGDTTIYFGGFFDASKRTLKDEIREIAQGLRTFAQLSQLSEIIEAAPRNDAGKITFATWDNVVVPALRDMGVQGAPRLVHGSQWGDL